MITSWWSPSTDLGVVVQVTATVAVAAVLLWFARRERSLVLLIVGASMVTLGWYGIRGLH